ncbi:MAG: ABC transporter permease subunit, partial [Thermaurantiacus sp.]
RAIAIEVLASDYIRYARAQGLPARDIRRMVLRNAMVPVVTFVGTELAGLVGTTALIEYVFAWGGVGQFGLNAIVQGDFAVVQGYVLMLALFSVIVFLVVDIAVLLLEPRAVRA